jgi:hypothetical protein
VTNKLFRQGGIISVQLGRKQLFAEPMPTRKK